MRIIAIILIVVGAIGLTYGFVSFTHKEKVIDAGPIQVTADKEERFNVTPWLGGGIIAVGVVLLLLPMRK